MQFLPGMSLAVTTVNSSHGSPSPKWMPRIRPRAIGLRTVTPYSMSGQMQIVDVLRLSGDFFAAFFARDGFSDEACL